ncbi:DUF3124 domain-containing protein [Aureispira sp. CCB-QB1]|uniref:DUF3124 domain-containing protein n=1 Tax=Aureispira sp. CCB-QB1 TaxID=1313421 RepID=UPI000695D199|nr:DUF3124 domain-containing protein [Aureispira sp. CCB-QB1]
MKKYLYFLLIITFASSCHEEDHPSSLPTQNWSEKFIDIQQIDSLEYGKSYLSIYSQIYSADDKRVTNLTAMVSLRNTSDTDTIYLLSASYYDTYGALIRTYFDQPVFLSPMETTEIIIDLTDVSGGTGSNFLFEWKIPLGCPEPLFEGIMNSTKGQQGLSFSTQAKRIK